MTPDSNCRDDTAPPPLTVTAPDGSRVTVAVPSTTSTVGELADSLGLPRRSELLLDGRPVERRATLDRVEIAQGSRLTERPTCRSQVRARSPWTDTRGPVVPTATVEPRGPGVVLVAEAGPAAGATVELGPGRHVIGRAAGARICLDDELVELHHAVLDVDRTGQSIAVTQVAGRVPCRVATEGTDPAAAPKLEPVQPGTVLTAGAVLALGATRLRVRDTTGSPPVPAAAVSPLRHDPWRRTLHRMPRPLATWQPAPIEPPAEHSSSLRSAGGLLAAILSILGGIAVAVVMQNPMFLVFSGVGFVVAIGNRLGGRLSDRKQRKRLAGDARRERQRFADQVAAQRSAFIAHHRAAATTIDATISAVRQLNAHVWCRRSDHDDAFTATLGWGSVDWSVALGQGEMSAEADAVVRAAERLGDQPVVTALGRGSSLAIVGTHAAAVARSLVVQLATWTGPADWRVVVVAGDTSEWEWCGWLPHANSAWTSDADPLIVAADDPGAVAGVFGRLDDGDSRHVVVVTDRPELLATRTGALRRFLGSASSVAVVAVVGDGGSVPSMCRSLLEIGSLGHARWCPDTSTATNSLTLHAAGLTVADADDAARRLARLHDPEDPCEAAGATPATVSLSRLLTRCGQGAVDDPIAIAAGWRTGPDSDGVPGVRGDGRPRAAIGLTADGVVEIDLVRDGPHALIAGTTGSGKSELLRTLVVSLAARCSPDDLTFVLIDYKGGSTFDACADLPHTVGMVTDLDDRLAERALISLEAEIRRRERLLRDAAADNLEVYRESRPDAPLPRLVVVIDEFAAMAAELPGFLSSLVGVAQRGRSLGIHLILATQRPAGVVSDEIRANTNLRIALRLQDRTDAMDVVGDAQPSLFARGTPGRAMMRLGPGESLVFQTAHSAGLHQPVDDGGLRVLRRSARPGRLADDDRWTEAASTAPAAGLSNQATELVVLTRSVRGAASLCEVAPPFRPWLEPLSEAIGPRDLVLGDGRPAGSAAVGLVDDPAGQQRLALTWERSDGNLALVGSYGSGTSTALRSVLVAAADAHVYVIDARGDGGVDGLGQLPWCGAVVGVHDVERRNRLLRMLASEVGRRQATASAQHSEAPWVLAIDGLPALNAALSGQADMEDHAQLVRILADGAAVGVSAVATLERPAGIGGSILSSFGQRWLFHLDDPAEAAGLGIKTAMTPPAVPGRIVVVGSRLEGQVAVLPLHRGPRANGRTESPMAIGTLPDDVDAATLPATVDGGDGTTPLVLGLDFASIAPTALDVPDGEHAIILGPARSGRSTAIIRAIAAFRAARPAGTVIVRCPRRQSPVLAWVGRNVPDAVVAADDAAIVAATGDSGEGDAIEGPARVLIAIDDAERVDDTAGALFDMVTARHHHVLVVAAGRPDALRSMYGHWTTVVRRSRIGLVMTKGGEADGELLGEILPRRQPVGARPGLAWLFDGNGRRLVQVARDVR